LVLLTLSLIWIVGIVYYGYSGTSGSRLVNGYVAQDRWYECRKAQRTNCDSERSMLIHQYDQSAQGAWVNIIAIAAIPPALLLPLSWLLFDRKKKQTSLDAA
jgi:hypothetical protein